MNAGRAGNLFAAIENKLAALVGEADVWFVGFVAAWSALRPRLPESSPMTVVFAIMVLRLAW